MFGYVRPLKSEMKVREFEQFKAVYCGLCHALKDRYGLAARFCLNYDFVFLAALLSACQEKTEYSYRRCIESPFRKKCCCAGSAPLSAAAGYSLILAYWKIRDQIADSPPLASVPHRLRAIFFLRGYKKAVRDFPEFDRVARQKLKELSELEAAGSDRIDLTADKFACILTVAASQMEGAEEKRIVEQILYHTGRWIYIVDAYDDLKRDAKSGDFNPLLRRFSSENGGLRDEDTAAVRTTLLHSVNFISASFELLPAGQWSGILRNIIYQGFPWVTDLVLSGHWKKPRDNHPAVDKRG